MAADTNRKREEECLAGRHGRSQHGHRNPNMRQGDGLKSVAANWVDMEVRGRGQGRSLVAVSAALIGSMADPFRRPPDAVAEVGGPRRSRASSVPLCLIVARSPTDNGATHLPKGDIATFYHNFVPRGGLSR